MSICALNHVYATDVLDWRTPPGKLYSIGGYSLHLNCQGEGTPVVVLDAGLGGFSLDWFYVQEDLSQITRVCSYDRAGYGWSDEGPPPRTTDQIVEELYELLDVAGVKSPYILVGHSFGGFNMIYFAKSYPALVAGLVLVDSSHPDQFEALPDMPHPDMNDDVGRKFSFFYPGKILYSYPEQVRETALRLLTTRKAFSTQRRELINFRYSGVQVKQLGHINDLPLVVISRGRSDWPNDPRGQLLEKTWQRLQKDLVELVPHGRQIIAEGSGHMIQLERPDVIIKAVSNMLDELKTLNLTRDTSLYPE